jgi:PhoPQ-activated pathogenicity-related protein
MRRAFLLALCVVLLCASISTRLPGEETALDRYVAQPDAAYSWKLASIVPGEGYTTFVLDLTSQTWRTTADVDRPVWKHWLSIVKPHQATRNTAFLFIGGGSNRDAMPKTASPRTIELAVGTGTVVAELGTVPNQPLFFTDSKDEGRSEDNLIAYTRVKYFENHDPTWLVRLAMVKSGVRAMDAIQEFLASEAGGKLKIDKFVVAGGSKRGWTTWLVGAVDRRVIAIIPMVIDALNSEVITRHHFEAYGFFSPALKDYVRHGLFPGKVGTPEYREILKIEDPYNYRDRPRLKIPKYLINASGDQFFLPDNSQFYFNELPEEKYLRYVPNAKHDLKDSDARESLQAFYQAVLDGTPRPKFAWKKEKDGSLLVTVTDKPAEVNVWQATNPEARDFRVDTIGKAYTSNPLKPQADGTYLTHVNRPTKGFTAFFVELVYPSGGKYPLKFTTEVSVVPDVLPFTMPTAAK